MITNNMIGFVLAFLSMIIYSLYMVPRRCTDLCHAGYGFWMGFGVLISSNVIGLMVVGLPSVTLIQYLIMLSCGIIWGTGSLGYAYSVKTIGLSKGSTIKNLSALFGTAVGIFIFREFSVNNPIALLTVVLGSILILISTLLLGRCESTDLPLNNIVSKRILLLGFGSAFWAAVAYTAYTIPMKFLYREGITPIAFLMLMGHGCFIGMSIPKIYALIKSRNIRSTTSERFLAILSGTLWSLGSLCANIAVSRIGVAITWPMGKTILFAALFGAFLLKEVNFKTHKRDFFLGITLSTIGIVLLAVSLLQK